MKPLSAGRYALQVTIREETLALLREAQALLGHEVDPRDVPEVLHRALQCYVARLRQRKFAATSRPRGARHQASPRGRHIPAQVKRTVWARDGGQCTFVSDSGQRCTSRTRLEFDHIEPVARGGESTVDNLRLRCRAHNQLAAERAFGAGFMDEKRAAAQQRSGSRRAHAHSRGPAAAAEDRARATAEEARARAAAIADVVPWLRALGLRKDEAERAVAHCGQLDHAPLEQRVRHALACCAGPGKQLAPARQAAT